MSTSKKIILILGLAWCCVCALFPPRQYVDIGNVRDARLVPSHEFLFSPNFQVFHDTEKFGYRYFVDVNGGRLLAELALVAAITGITFLLHEWFIQFKAWKP